MTVQIHIEGEDAGHALRELKGLAEGLVGSFAPATWPAAAEAPASEPAAPKAARGRKAKEEQVKEETADKAQVAALGEAEKPNISTDPENRIDPANPEDEAQDEAQDAADEAAEVEAGRSPEQPLTIEDMKAAITKYVQKFDLAAAQADGPGIFKSVLGDPPAGQEYWKLSIVPYDDQAKVAKAIKAWEDAAAKAERTQAA